MADKKITELTNITGANLVDADEFVVVDISADETKAITLGELKEAFDAGSGFVRVTGDTMTGALDVQSTITADGIGIGTSSPAHPLDVTGTIRSHVSTTGDFNFSATSAGGGAFRIYPDDATTGNPTWYYQSNSSEHQAWVIGGVERMRLAGDDLTVTGTVTADRFLIETGAGNDAGTIISTDSTVLYSMVDSGGSSQFRNVNGAYSIRTGGDAGLTTNTKERATFASTGDISFYEDTGTTPKFFWDASAESLGIGTSSIQSNTSIHIVGADGASGASANVAANELFIDNDGSTGMTLGSANDGVGYYAFADPDVAIRGGLFYDHSTDDMGFRVASQTRMTLDNFGNVGIGTDSPLTELHVKKTSSDADVQIESTSSGGDARLNLYANSAGVSQIRFGDEATTNVGLLTYDHSDDSMALRVNAAEAMRIDSAGHAIIPAGVTLGTAAGVYAAANTLDDYETGSFTPTFTSTGTNPSGVTYDPTVGNEGHYTKIGKVVHIQINIRTDAISNKGSGNLQVSGLPFVSSDYDSQGGIAVFPCYSSAFLNNNPSYGLLAEAETTLSLAYRSTASGDLQNVPTSSLNTGANDNIVRITGTYMTEE